MENKTFAIVGGGIGGLTLALALHRKNIPVTVYESARELKPVGAGLALAGNAMRALMEIGIADAVTERGKVLKSMAVLDWKGRVLTQTDAELLSRKLGVVNNFTIHRADLHAVLARPLLAETFILNKHCTGVVQHADGVVLSFADGTSADAGYVIACDGIHSPLRRAYLPDSEPRYAGYTCWRGVTDYIPAGVDMDKTTETWGLGRRFGIVPLKDGRIYWFATRNAPYADPDMKRYTVKDVRRIFEGFHFPVTEIIERTPEERLIWSDIIDLKPLKRFAFGRVVLTGDAAHATTPNMGQGACMAIEDAVVLANLIERYEGEEAFRQFERRRIARTTRIVNDSFRLGKLAQWQNPVLAGIRNTLMRMTPPAVAEKQLRYLTDISFS